MVTRIVFQFRFLSNARTHHDMIESSTFFFLLTHPQFNEKLYQYDCEISHEIPTIVKREGGCIFFLMLSINVYVYI